jgi:hypothetical protein
VYDEIRGARSAPRRLEAASAKDSGAGCPLWLAQSAVRGIGCLVHALTFGRVRPDGDHGEDVALAEIGQRDPRLAVMVRVVAASFDRVYAG